MAANLRRSKKHGGSGTDGVEAELRATIRNLEERLTDAYAFGDTESLLRLQPSIAGARSRLRDHRSLVKSREEKAAKQAEMERKRLQVQAWKAEKQQEAAACKLSHLKKPAQSSIASKITEIDEQRYLRLQTDRWKQMPSEPSMPHPPSTASKMMAEIDKARYLGLQTRRFKQQMRDLASELKAKADGTSQTLDAAAAAFATKSVAPIKDSTWHRLCSASFADYEEAFISPSTYYALNSLEYLGAWIGAPASSRPASAQSSRGSQRGVEGGGGGSSDVRFRSPQQQSPTKTRPRPASAHTRPRSATAGGRPGSPPVYRGSHTTHTGHAGATGRRPQSAGPLRRSLAAAHRAGADGAVSGGGGGGGGGDVSGVRNGTAQDHGPESSRHPVVVSP